MDFDPLDTIRSTKQQVATRENMEVLKAERSHITKRSWGNNASMPDALYGDLDPVHINKRETPVHRTMVNMAAAGYEIGEIAALTGRCPATVSTALKQPYARRYLINEAKKTVQDEIKELLQSEALPSIRKLVQVRDSTDARGADIITASNSILDRFLGKPTQPILTNEKPADQLTDDELKLRANALLSRFSSLEGVEQSPAS